MIDELHCPCSFPKLACKPLTLNLGLIIGLIQSTHHIFQWIWFTSSTFITEISFCFNERLSRHYTPLVRWSLHKYKCLWNVEGKGRGSSLQEGASHTYTLRLSQSRILSCIKKKLNKMCKLKHTTTWHYIFKTK